MLLLVGLFGSLIIHNKNKMFALQILLAFFMGVVAGIFLFLSVTFYMAKHLHDVMGNPLHKDDTPKDEVDEIGRASCRERV